MENEREKNRQKSVLFSRAVPGLLILGGGHGLATSQFHVL
jgi:hypothetical protein